MSSPSSPPTRLVPTYASIALQVQNPMQHGDAKRFLTNPAVYGLSAPAEQFGQLLCFAGRYFVAGPACQFSEFELTTAAISGSVARLNCEARTQAARLFLCHTQDEALAMLWHLVAEHYHIPEAEAAAQVTQQRRRDEAEAGFEQAHLTNGNDPRINDPADWIPDYPPSPGDGADNSQNEDRAGHPAQPADEQHD